MKRSRLGDHITGGTLTTRQTQPFLGRRTMKLHLRSDVLLVATLAFTAACASEEASAVREVGSEQAAGSGRKPRIEVCKLLSDVQVRNVVPDLAGSMVVSSGESLMKTVESYQCSHVNTSAEGLIVEVHFAADDKSFKLITGGGPDRFETEKKLDIGDASWIYTKDTGMIVTVHQGRTLVELLLNTKDAAQKGQALTELARTVAAKVR
jgi:hypothetical protein